MLLRLALLAAAAAASPAAAQTLAYAVDAAAEEESGPRLDYALLDRFEWAAQPGEDGYAWDFSLLYGGDTNRIWLSSVGEGSASGSLDYLELQALYSRTVGAGWDANAGLRWDAVRPRRAYLAVGGQLNREWEKEGRDLWVGTFAYLSHKGELSGRVGAVYNHSLAGDLVLQPSFELNASADDVPELLIGRGLTYAEAGLRLRYERSEKFAPYVGLSWERSLGRTARMERDAGEDPDTKSVVVGIRSGFSGP